jgi:hypothetical protein
MKNAVFWDVAPCDSCWNRRFEVTCRLHLQGDWVWFRLLFTDDAVPRSLILRYMFPSYQMVTKCKAAHYFLRPCIVHLRQVQTVFLTSCQYFQVAARSKHKRARRLTVTDKQTNIQKTNSAAPNPQVSYTDWAIATCWRNLVPTFADRDVSRDQRGGSPTVVNLSFLDRSRYFSFK